jgi:sialate O-acetylesterase
VIFRGGEAIVTFSHAGGMRSADGKGLRSFEIAGTDKIFKPAIAEIAGDKIEVFSKEVKKPEYVRYGWQPYSEGNLVNGAGLPASTFSSEYGK